LFSLDLVIVVVEFGVNWAGERQRQRLKARRQPRGTQDANAKGNADMNMKQDEA